MDNLILRVSGQSDTQGQWTVDSLILWVSGQWTVRYSGSVDSGQSDTECDASVWLGTVLRLQSRLHAVDSMISLRRRLVICRHVWSSECILLYDSPLFRRALRFRLYRSRLRTSRCLRPKRWPPPSRRARDSSRPTCPRSTPVCSSIWPTRRQSSFCSNR